MSTISKIFDNYRKALYDSRLRYEDLYKERVKNAQDFYQKFFNKLIKQYKTLFSDLGSLYQIKKHILQFFETDQIDFVAIDGTCSKDPFKDFITFFGGAYGAKGRISLEGDPPKVKYHKWAMNMENNALKAIRQYANNKTLDVERVLKAILEYDTLLLREYDGNHHYDKYMKTLVDRPWEKCNCEICKEIGVEVIIFRGANRNKRRGFHNTKVFYECILKNI